MQRRLSVTRPSRSSSDRGHGLKAGDLIPSSVGRCRHFGHEKLQILHFQVPSKRFRRSELHEFKSVSHSLLGMLVALIDKNKQKLMIIQLNGSHWHGIIQILQNFQPTKHQTQGSLLKCGHPGRPVARCWLSFPVHLALPSPQPRPRQQRNAGPDSAVPTW